MKPAFIIDSTTFLSDELRDLDNIYVADLTLHFSNGDVMKDPDNIQDINAFYERMETESELPTTSQPTLDTYYEFYEQILDAGYTDVYILHLSGGISGTYQSSAMVAEEYSDRLNIHIFDTKAASTLNLEILNYILKNAMDGMPYEEIDRGVEYIIEHQGMYLMVGQLDNLTKGGRLSTTEAFIGNLLRVRPMIHFTDEGKLEMFDKIRSNRRVYRQIIEWAHEYADKYGDRVIFNLAHGDAEEDVLELKEMLQAEFPDYRFNIAPLSPVIGNHTGSGALGFGYTVLPPTNE